MIRSWKILAAAAMTISTGLLVASPNSTAQARPDSGQRVDLRLFYDVPTLPLGGQATQTFAVDNVGAPATGPELLAITLPAFVHTDPAGALPQGCRVRYADPGGDPAMPEVLSCTLAPLTTGQTRTLPIPLIAAATAPTGSAWGAAVVRPAAGSADADSAPADGVGTPSVSLAAPSSPPSSSPSSPPSSPPSTQPRALGHRTDLFLATDLPPLAAGQSGIETFTVGNRGPDATSGPVRVVIATPPYVRIDNTQPLPPNCQLRFTPADPALPQVLRCQLVDDIDAGAGQTLAVRLTPEPGAPVQTIWGVSDVLSDPEADSIDTDPVLANNCVEAGVQVIG